MPKKRLLVFMGPQCGQKPAFVKDFGEPPRAASRYSVAGVIAVTGASSRAR